MQNANQTGQRTRRGGTLLPLTVFAAGLAMAVSVQAAVDAQLKGETGNPVSTHEQSCVHGMDWNRSMSPCNEPTVVVDNEKVKIVFTLDDAAFFGDDKATLNAASMKELDRLVRAVGPADAIHSILITGHADRIGPEPYNVALAQHRADNVKTYLIDKGLPGEKIIAAGEGLDEPWVSCPDVHGEHALIKCLAPNRRVDVEAVFSDDVDIANIAIIPPAQ